MIRGGRRLALLIGVQEYRSDRYKDLPSVGVDVRELAKVLRQPDIGHFDQVIDDLGPQPTAEDIRVRISTFLSMCEADDLVVLYFSGHGVRATRVDSQLYFVASDTDPDRFTETAVSGGFVNRALEKCRAERKVAILDCCMSGGFALGFRDRDEKSAEPSSRPKPVLETTGVYVLSSSRLSEASFSGKTSKDPSLFTGAIVQGLATGEADTDRDGSVGVDELFRYASDLLRAVDQPEAQTPVKSTLQASGEIHLAHAPIKRSKPFAGGAAGDRQRGATGSHPPQRSVSWDQLLEYYRQAVVTEQSGAQLMDAGPNALGYVCLAGPERLLSGALDDSADIVVPPEAAQMADKARAAKKDLLYGYPMVVLHRDSKGVPYRRPQCAPLLIRPVKVVEAADGTRLQPYGTAQVNPALARELLDPDTATQLGADYRPTWIAGGHADMAKDIRYLLREEFALEEVEPLRPEALKTGIDVATPTDGARNAAALMPGNDGASARLIQDLEDLRKNHLSEIQNTALGALLDQSPSTRAADDQTQPVLIGQSNDAQLAVLRTAVSRRLTVATGPPGTGKSELIANLVATAVCSNKTALTASTNNQAVDEVHGRCQKRVPGLVVRTGNRDYRQVEHDALTGLLRTADSPRKSSTTTLAAAHVEESRQSEEAFAAVSAKAGWEQQLFRCGHARQAALTGLAELGVEPLPAWAALNDDQLRRTLARITRVADTVFFGRWRRRRLLHSLGLSVDKEYHAAVCALVRDTFDNESQWRHLMKQRHPSDASLTAQLAVTADQLRGAGRALTSGQVAAGAAAGVQHIQDLLGSLQPGSSRNSWTFYPRVLPHVRGWAVSALTARNFPLQPGLFDLVIIDEASQCSIAAVLPLLFRAKSALIVGDPMQLRHIASLRPEQDAAAAESVGLDPAWLADRRLSYQRYSAFDACEARAGESLLLDEHYRCHPQIATIADDLFYAPRGKRLTILTDPRSQRSVPNSTRPRVAWDDVAGRAVPGPGGRSWLNPAEADTAARRARWLLDTLPAGASVGIVTPFRAQAQLIASRLGDLTKQVRVGTVHTFQGGECDAIIFSLVATPTMSGGGLRFFDRDENLWNVAITRARAHLLVVGHGDFWQRHGALGGKLWARINAFTTQDAPWPHGEELRNLLYRQLQRVGAKHIDLGTTRQGIVLDATFVLADQPIAVMLDTGGQADQDCGRYLRRQLVRAQISAAGDTAVRLPAWRVYADDAQFLSALAQN
ncbi:caspase, EACC1-associated type [Catenulispora pinisilvae]|uniref:caspase, EACC1-associated type n=1 Tax=Catenulispora pinisilvae TaxID=2705253 RepID=UPI002B26705D|nr:AAA domain-containing protein [Catenulispora pinisilvae]